MAGSVVVAARRDPWAWPREKPGERESKPSEWGVRAIRSMSVARMIGPASPNTLAHPAVSLF